MNPRDALGVLAGLAALAAPVSCARRSGVPGPPAWRSVAVGTLAEQDSRTRALLQAVSAASDSVVWVAGHQATWVRTVDGGRTWVPGRMGGPDSMLEFRDVHAVDANTAYLLAAGPGERSRIYKTTDAGASWQLQFVNRDPAAFFDCFDFADPRHGLAVSDAVNGRLIVLRTEDGGAHWERVPDDGIPPALPGEGAFAASGTCLVARGRRVWIGTGNAAGPARVFRSTDGGRHWSVAATPIPGGPASGVAALAFGDAAHGIALGGRLGAPDESGDSVAAWTEDGGRTWALVHRPDFPGPVYGAAGVPGLPTYVVAVGPGGLAWTADEGRTWKGESAGPFWSVTCVSPRAGWAVGPGGRIARITFGPPLVN